MISSKQKHLGFAVPEEICFLLLLLLLWVFLSEISTHYHASRLSRI